ncbi:hypothetical protein [Spirosoma koreense]
MNRTRLLLIMHLIMLVSTLQAQHQPCQRLDITDKKQRQVLAKFIRDSRKKGFLTADSGMVNLSERRDREGQLVWYLTARKYWRRYQPATPFVGHCLDCLSPSGWTQVDNHVVLRHASDQREDTLSLEESRCLQQLLAPTVAIWPPLPIPPKEVPRKDYNGQLLMDKNGRVQMEPYRWPLYGGSSGHNDLFVTFQKDGSIVKKRPL